MIKQREREERGTRETHKSSEHYSSRRRPFERQPTGNGDDLHVRRRNFHGDGGTGGVFQFRAHGFPNENAKHEEDQSDTSQRHPFGTGTVRNAHFADVGPISRPSSNASVAQSALVPGCTRFIEGMLVHFDGGVRCDVPGQVDQNVVAELVVVSTQASRWCFALVKGIVGVGAPPPVFGCDETPI